MDDVTYECLLADYRDTMSRYVDLALGAKTLVEQLLADRGIMVHSVTSRHKDPSSLARKLRKPDADYSSLGDITDLAGVRITTYFEPDVSLVSRLINEEFEIDTENSVDKGDSLDPDRFGYLSVHHIASLSKTRSKLTEYRRFNGMKFEIQVRSILQHAWAEIEHDLGYKSKQSVPKQVRRRFSRIAGLLELADAEFAAIRAELTKYEEIVPEKIQREPERVGIDKASVHALFTTSSIVKRIDKAIASLSDGMLPTTGSTSLEGAVKRLRYFNLETIAQVKGALVSREGIIVNFAELWLENRPRGVMEPGICVFYLGYVLIAESGDLAAIRQYVSTFGISEKVSEDVLSTYDEAKSKPRSKRVSRGRNDRS